jgi:hypothetical protein
MLAHGAAVLERLAIGIGELQVGNAVACLGGQPARLRESLLIELCQPHEAAVPACCDLVRGAIGTEELVFVELVERNQGRDATPHSRVSGQRSVLGPGEIQARLRSCKPCDERRGAKRVQAESDKSRIHQARGYLSKCNAT